jgi:glutathione S-transferase
MELMVSFSLFRPEKLPGPIERYNDEVKRLLGVLELHLSKPENKGYLVAGRYTIADLSFIAWLNVTELLPVKLADYPAVDKMVHGDEEPTWDPQRNVGGPLEQK